MASRKRRPSFVVRAPAVVPDALSCRECGKPQSARWMLHDAARPFLAWSRPLCDDCAAGVPEADRARAAAGEPVTGGDDGTV